MGCGVSKFEVEETGLNPEVRFVYPKNEAPIVNEKDVGDELAETEQSFNNNGRKSLSIERGFLKKVFGNSSEKGGEKDVEGDQGGRKSISSHLPMLMENGLFAKESGSFAKYQEFQDENMKRVSSVDKSEKVNSMDMRISIEMAKDEARRISVEVATKEVQRINAEVAKEEAKRNYNTNSTMEETNMPSSTEVGKDDAKMPYNIDQMAKEQKYVNEEKPGIREEYMRENNIMFPPGSPSFRIYCLLDKDGSDNAEDGDRETQGSKLPPTGRGKRSGSEPAKRRRRTSLLRNVLQRGGSAAGVKNFLHVKHSATNQDSTSDKIVEKAA